MAQKDTFSTNMKGRACPYDVLGLPYIGQSEKRKASEGLSTHVDTDLYEA